MTTQAFKISGMSCTSCIMHIEELEDKLPGVQKIDVNFKKHQMVAEFDETKISGAQIAEAVTDIGYPAVATGVKDKKRGFLPWTR